MNRKCLIPNIFAVKQKQKKKKSQGSNLIQKSPGKAK